MSEKVKLFQSKMPAAITDEKLRADVIRKIPAEVQRLRIIDPFLTEKLRKIIAPVLRLYGREDVYQIIVFKHSTPVMFSDTGLLLVVSTGMIERSMSDDELLGYTAHEVAHEAFASYSIFTKHLLRLVVEGGKEAAIDRKLSQMLAIVELQCDAFAAATVAHLNASPLSFIEGMEAIGKDFPNHQLGFHPPDSIRRRVVEQVIPQSYLRASAKQSQKLIDLKKYVQTLLEAK